MLCCTCQQGSPYNTTVNYCYVAPVNRVVDTRLLLVNVMLHLSIELSIQDYFYRNGAKHIKSRLENVINWVIYCCFHITLFFIYIKTAATYKNRCFCLNAYEPRREKTGLRGFRPGSTQTGMCSQKDSKKFWIKKVEKLYYLYRENKGADQLRGYCEADLRLCFRIGKIPVFSRCGSYTAWLYLKQN